MYGIKHHCHMWIRVFTDEGPKLNIDYNGEKIQDGL